MALRTIVIPTFWSGWRLRGRQAFASLHQSNTTADNERLLERPHGSRSEHHQRGLCALSLQLRSCRPHGSQQHRQPVWQHALAVFHGRSQTLFLRSAADLCNTCFNLSFLAAPSTMVVSSLVIGTALGSAKHVHCDSFKLHAKIFRDHLTACQDRDVLQHGFAAIAETRCFTAAIFRPPRSLFTTRVASASPSTSSAMIKKWLATGSLAQAEEPLAAVKTASFRAAEMRHLPARGHFVWVGDKVRRQVTAVKLHAFDNISLCFQTFVLFDSDHAFVANFLHRICDLLADFGFAIGRDRAHLRNFSLSVTATCSRFDRVQQLALSPGRYRASDPSGSCRGNGFHAFFDDGLCQNCRSGCAVASFIIGA